jgi:hypothetical protein
MIADPAAICSPVFAGKSLPSWPGTHVPISVRDGPPDPPKQV